MDEHVIFYLDLLGFTSALREPAGKSAVILTELLTDLASLRGDFDLIEDKSDNGQRFNIRAAVSTFSDHIVINTHFDYVRQMILRCGEQGEKLAAWLEGVRRTAIENIDRFEREERWNEFSKWIWFRNMLDRSRG